MKFCIKLQNGFGLIEVLVGTALLGTVAMLYSQGSTSNLKSRKKLELAAGFGSVEQAFASELDIILRNLSPAKCLTSNQIETRKFGSSSGNVGLRFSTHIGSNLPAELLPDDTSFATESGAAKERCKTPVFIPDSAVANPAKNHLHFCFDFEKSSVGAEGSLQGSEHAFAEVSVYFKNPLNAQPASCEQFLGDRKKGAQVFYSLFWSQKENNKISYNRKSGLMFAKSPKSP
ncbi:MAG: prepilin-type N-terminal cleavage/methylation domain-containing protein [Proteobacteria bacterium]|nr:prepilin-type N-terminal cleavage/methylation domain-containing protein [Pseudomonadota bacterium]